MWNLLVTEDEALIARSVREYLSSEFPIERLRPKAAALDTVRVLRGMYELGWFGVGLPEEAAGAGLGLVEEMLVQRECGRFLVSPTELGTVLAARVALHANNIGLAREFASGYLRAALALPLSSDIRRGSVAVSVFDWSEGDWVVCWNDGGMGLLEPAAGSSLSFDQCIDESVRLHSGAVDFSLARHWVAAGTAPLGLRAQVLLAAALVGVAEHACDLTVEYAKVRKQFGQPIGAFQAVKHRCADMGVRWRMAWYQTCRAALEVQAGAAGAALSVAAAKLLAARAAHENGRAAIQLHGGIGFQSECDAHWFMKRAHVYDQLGGAMRAQARRVVHHTGGSDERTCQA
jgi:alkylation response protein AidB-like acyl-CoA dehydrogenase